MDVSGVGGSQAAALAGGAATSSQVAVLNKAREADQEIAAQLIQSTEASAPGSVDGAGRTLLAVA